MGRPVVRISALAAAPERQIKYGLLKGEPVVPNDLDVPWPDGVLADFEGRPWQIQTHACRQGFDLLGG